MVTSKIEVFSLPLLGLGVVMSLPNGCSAGLICINIMRLKGPQFEYFVPPFPVEPCSQWEFTSWKSFAACLSVRVFWPLVAA